MSAWWDTTKELFNGSWGPVFDVADGDETARAVELAQRNAELEARRVAMGIDTAAEAQAQIDRFSQDRPENYLSQSADEFVSGWQIGYEAETTTIKNVQKGIFGFVWDALSWQLIVTVIVIGGGYLLYVTGAGAWLIRAAKAKLS